MCIISKAGTDRIFGFGFKFLSTIPRWRVFCDFTPMGLISLIGLLIKYQCHGMSPEDGKGWMQKVLSGGSPPASLPQFLPSHRNSRVDSAVGVAGHSK